MGSWRGVDRAGLPPRPSPKISPPPAHPSWMGCLVVGSTPTGQRRGSWRTWSGLITASAANALIGSDPSEADELDYSSQTALAASICNAMNSFSTHIWWAGLLELAGDSTEEERQACCNALAGYLLARSR